MSLESTAALMTPSWHSLNDVRPNVDLSVDLMAEDHGKEEDW